MEIQLAIHTNRYMHSFSLWFMAAQELSWAIRKNNIWCHMLVDCVGIGTEVRCGLIVTSILPVNYQCDIDTGSQLQTPRAQNYKDDPLRKNKSVPATLATGLFHMSVSTE